MDRSRATEMVHLGGLAVAFLGFGLTRFVVADTLTVETSLSSFVGLVPLVIGLVFSIYGVVLAVGDLSNSYVDTVVRWTFFGVLLMVGILVMTALSSGAINGLDMLRDSELLVANVVLGGAVGGALTGDRAGLNRRNREEIELQAELALIANGLLRHEVLNATSIIDGYASLFSEGDTPRESDVAAIRTATDRIETTVADVGEVGRARNSESLEPTPFVPVLRDEIDRFQDRYANATVTLTVPDDELRALADHRLRLLVRKLLKTVTARSVAPTIHISVTDANDTIWIDLRAEEPTVAEIGGEQYSDPVGGFDRRITELLVAYYNGSFDLVDPDARKTASPAGAKSERKVSLELPQTVGDSPGVGRLGISSAGLAAAIGTGIVAGVVMGILSQTLSGSIPVIGALYGVPNLAVGWVTHLFHSVVFALLFAAGLTHLHRWRDVDRRLSAVALGIGWGGLLWLVAAGMLMPFWLQLVGIPATIPNVTAVGLFTHLVWGLSVGLLYVPLRDWFATSDVVTNLISKTKFYLPS